MCDIFYYCNFMHFPFPSKTVGISFISSRYTIILDFNYSFDLTRISRKKLLAFLVNPLDQSRGFLILFPQFEFQLPCTLSILIFYIINNRFFIQSYRRHTVTPWPYSSPSIHHFFHKFKTFL